MCTIEIYFYNDFAKQDTKKPENQETNTEKKGSTRAANNKMGSWAWSRRSIPGVATKIFESPRR